MADFVKAVDPNHLVMVGTWGYFGASSPELLAENPQDLSWRASDSSNNAGIWSAGEQLTRLHSNFKLGALTLVSPKLTCKYLVTLSIQGTLQPGSWQSSFL